MNEQIFVYRIKHRLDDALVIDAGVQKRLKASRELALSRRQIEAPRFVFAWAGNSGINVGEPRSIAYNVALSTAIFIAGLFAIHHWYESQIAEEIEEIDAKVLTGDLPLDAYLDKGFDAWLKRSSQ